MWRLSVPIAVAAAAVVALVLAPGTPARQTAAQKLFAESLLDDRAVSRDVKTRLRKGGFVDRRIQFIDLTGEGRSDAVVLVHSGSSAARVALYVFSAGMGDELKLVYRNQRLYRVTARARDGVLTYTVPLYERGDELCCPSASRATDLRWDPRLKRFRVVDRRTT